MSQDSELSGPDLSLGVDASTLADGTMLLGHAHGEAVLLVRRGDEAFAVGATCTHYGGPLAEGLLEGEQLRCPWHHACFDLRSGEATCAPALNPLPRWRVERRGDRWQVAERIEATPPPRRAANAAPESIVIIGGGAAGNAAAEMLRRQGHAGRITMLSDDDTVPYDRPNLSKNYLAGNAPEDWIPLRTPEFYRDQEIELVLNMPVEAIDIRTRELRFADASRIGYDALLIATGAEPARLDVPGADLPHVHLLRSLSDCRALISSLPGARRVVVVGAGFIGMEVAASLRARDLEVHVVAPGAVPMERALGAELGTFLRRLHEERGVVFHLPDGVAAIDTRGVRLTSGKRLDADLVVVGIGVRPRTALAETAGLAVDHGIVVDGCLQASAPGVYAAGDVARWPDAASGERIRVEHWVVAERQGQTVARNMLGACERFTAVPFFWTEQHGVTLAYVGHAERWDRVTIDGRIEAGDCTITYWLGGRRLAVATLGRDMASLRAELELERAAVAAAA
ncbi:MAG TPA: FAD-dependent oxidoreductase [Albitalea sp.]|nr:FAD-dependent oxidoreductase [Albitalea sp.]